MNPGICGAACCQKFAAAGDIFDAEMGNSESDDDGADRVSQEHRETVHESKGKPRQQEDSVFNSVLQCFCLLHGFYPVLNNICTTNYHWSALSTT